MALAQRGQRVLLIDLDPQASLTESLGVKPTDLTRSLHDVLLGEVALLEVAIPLDAFTLIPSVIDLASAEILMSAEVGRDQILTEALAPALDQFDWILIDCPPSLSLLTLNALTAADEYLVPCETQFLALHGLHAMLRHDLPHVRSMVQRWNHVAIANAEERAAMLTALDGLRGDLEHVMRQIQAQDPETSAPPG